MKLNAWDRLTLPLFPEWTLKRVRARELATWLEKRHYEAASSGRRTQGWNRSRGDANAVSATALHELRAHARDLVRNNSWAKRGQKIIANNTIGWGIYPKAQGTDAARADELWKRWAGSTECHSEGRRTFYGLQHLAVRTIAISGEVLIRRRARRPSDGLSIPLQIEVLEPDFIDTAKDGVTGPAGGPIVNGVEYDMLGRRVAYWLFPQHPGANRMGSPSSRRVLASEILHVFDDDRPGAARGVSWFGTAIVNMKDLDEYDDAELVKQKIAACFAAFVEDTDAAGTALGEQSKTNEKIEQFEPGMVAYLQPGRKATFATPPTVTGDSLATRTLRRIAAGLGVTYEDLTGDYSQSNFSSARMSRLAHWANVNDWQWNMIVPLLCDGVWRWAMEAANLAGAITEVPAASWTCPPMPMIEPDKEGLALQRLVRVGAMTHDEMIRGLGGDPVAHWAEYAAGLERLDALKIKLDSDVRAVSQAGLTQERVGAAPKEPAALPAGDEKAT